MTFNGKSSAVVQKKTRCKVVPNSNLQREESSIERAALQAFICLISTKKITLLLVLFI